MTTAELAEYLLSAEDVEELFARNREHHKAIDGQLLAELESRLILASRGQGKPILVGSVQLESSPVP